MYSKTYYERNREKILLQRKEYWKKNKSRLYNEKRARLVSDPVLYDNYLKYLKKYRTKFKGKLQKYFIDYNIRNRDRLIIKSSNYYQKNKESLNAKKRIYHLKNKLYFNNLAIERYLKIKPIIQKQVLGFYSKNKYECACCKNNDGISFLTIDHINGRDKQQKRLTGFALQSWLKKNNYPLGYQVLCWNCNCTKGFFGKCCHIIPWDNYEYANNYMRKLKLDMLTAYSKPIIKCACCGEMEKGFLTLDHLNKKDPQHKGLRSQEIYQLLKKQGWPEGYQILCYNCNCAKGSNDKCPHQKVF